MSQVLADFNCTPEEFSEVYKVFTNDQLEWAFGRSTFIITKRANQLNLSKSVGRPITVFETEELLKAKSLLEDIAERNKEFRLVREEKIAAKKAAKSTK